MRRRRRVPFLLDHRHRSRSAAGPLGGGQGRGFLCRGPSPLLEPAAPSLLEGETILLLFLFTLSLLGPPSLNVGPHLLHELLLRTPVGSLPQLSRDNPDDDGRP